MLPEYFVNINKKRFRKSSNISYLIHDEVTKLLPMLMIGKRLKEEDFETKSANYYQFVKQFAGFLKYESEFYADVIEQQLSDDFEHEPKQKQGFKELFLSKCFDLSYLQECLNEFNIKLKKVQQISNRRWQTQVTPTLKDLVMCVLLLLLLLLYDLYTTTTTTQHILYIELCI